MCKRETQIEKEPFRRKREMCVREKKLKLENYLAAYIGRTSRLVEGDLDGLAGGLKALEAGVAISEVSTNFRSLEVELTRRRKVREKRKSCQKDQSPHFRAWLSKLSSRALTA